mgnify:CR=1 FL=1
MQHMQPNLIQNITQILQNPESLEKFIADAISGTDSKNPKVVVLSKNDVDKLIKKPTESTSSVRLKPDEIKLETENKKDNMASPSIKINPDIPDVTVHMMKGAETQVKPQKTELDELKEKIAKSTNLSEIAELGLQLATLAEKQEQEAKNAKIEKFTELVNDGMNTVLDMTHTLKVVGETFNKWQDVENRNPDTIQQIEDDATTLLERVTVFAKQLQQKIQDYK